MQWLYRALEDSRARGFLGPTSIEAQIEHSSGFIATWDELMDRPPERFLDLGSGGGLPGLVLFEKWETPTIFVDSMVKRTDFLTEVLMRPGVPAEGKVINGRAEDLSRDLKLEAVFPLVTARSFGPPAVTAECAVRFLAVGGFLIVSEPPQDHGPKRWNSSALGQLGLRSEGRARHGSAYHVLCKTRPTPPQYPREVGVPGKKPLF